MAILRTQQLGKDYGDIVAVKALDLEVEEGEIFGLLGPNGAGKTTAISMVCGVLTPSRGTASIAGFDIVKQSYDARRALGLVPQDLALYEDLSARQNLSFFGKLYALSGAELSERIDWALEVAGLSERAGDQVKDFSGGMKRRLNLVTGLLHKPKLLILDEPTVGVDPQSRNHLFETVRTLNKQHGMTVIYTSHYMEEVEALCERVAIVDHGQLIALDRVEDMLASQVAGTVEIEILGDTDAASAAVAQVLGDDGALERTRDTLQVRTTGHLGAAITAIEQCEGATVRAIRSLGSDLESVFLSLTGKRLRDD